MRKSTKALALLGCAATLVVGSVMGTMAYLTSQDQAVNTFTVGDVEIHLDEVDTDKSADTCDICKEWNEDRDPDRDHGNAYHLLPGHTYDKDPTVTVLEGSEDVYVRMMVKVENLESLKNALPYSQIVTDEDGTTHQVVNHQYYSIDEDDNLTFLLQMLCVNEKGEQTWDNAEWQYETFHATGDYANSYEFRYVGTHSEDGIVKKAESNTELEALFTDITVPGEIDNDHLAHLADVEIVVTAHAIQADGFDSADDAWTAFDN